MRYFFDKFLWISLFLAWINKNKRKGTLTFINNTLESFPLIRAEHAIGSGLIVTKSGVWMLFFFLVEGET